MKIPVRSQMRCGLLALALILLSYTARATTTTVHVGAGGGLTFTPNPVFIQPGDTIQWVWDASGHSATSGTPGQPDGIFDSGIQDVPFTYSHTFPTAATIPYYCTRHGAMMTGTINVVAPSPTPTPTPFLSISGTVIYCPNPALNPVPNVTLTLTGDASAVTTTDANGNYIFIGLASGGSYTVTPTKTALAPGTSGINTSDSIAVQRHFLSVGTPLSGCRLTAGDVNIPPNGVNTSDAIAIQRFFLSQVGGLAQTGTYEFNPVNRSYSPLTSNQTGQNFDALILGDAASGFVHRPEGGPSQDAAGNDGEVPVRVATGARPESALGQNSN